MILLAARDINAQPASQILRQAGLRQLNVPWAEHRTQLNRRGRAKSRSSRLCSTHCPDVQNTLQPQGEEVGNETGRNTQTTPLSPPHTLTLRGHHGAWGVEWLRVPKEEGDSLHELSMVRARINHFFTKVAHLEHASFSDSLRPFLRE